MCTPMDTSPDYVVEVPDLKLKKRKSDDTSDHEQEEEVKHDAKDPKRSRNDRLDHKKIRERVRRMSCCVCEKKRGFNSGGRCCSCNHYSDTCLDCFSARTS